MTRNLLPRLRNAPTPANIPLGSTGAWSEIQSPEELAKIEYDDPSETGLRTRIQAIPSPWARLLLFRNAFEDPGHPARDLVENEVLDALELVWSLEHLPGVSLDFKRVDMANLEGLGARTGSRRAQDFASALLDLVPRGEAPSGGSDLQTIFIGVVDGRPVFGSSPYTVVFTAEDAQEHASVRRFFDYSKGAPRRRLKDRPVPFQEYVAKVVRPQLYAAATSGVAPTPKARSLLGPWLDEELEACRLSAPAEPIRARLSSTPDGDWQAAARRLGLNPVRVGAIAGVQLFSQAGGTDLADSPMRLKSDRAGTRPPLVLVPDYFEGRYYPGAPLTELPGDLAELDRTRLPGLDLAYPWVSPEHDWFTDRIALLSEPIQRGAVHGYQNYAWVGRGADPRFADPHMLLPLRSEFFRFFSPQDVDRMLRIEIQSSGRIEVSLEIQLGNESSIRVGRVYDERHILNEHGPSFSVWPRFRSEHWPYYLTFRGDPSQAVASNFSVHAFTSEAEATAPEEERRTPLVATSLLGRAPEILELRGTFGSGEEPVGVLLPKFDPVPSPGHVSWDVGVDFGTSNTVVSIRADGPPSIFEARDLLLTLTEPAQGTTHLMDAYYFPERVVPRPFGTAIVFSKALPSLEIDKEPLGVRVNVPFRGDVDGYDWNEVRGDLKWSAEPHTHFLSAAFLRQVVALVVAEGIRQGVEPGNIRFRWAYPRAFSETQRNRLQGHWRTVLRSFSGVGLDDDALGEGLDESRSVLRHFFNTGDVHLAGAAKAIVDVGGGTSDIAIYGRGRVLSLDSVLLGGRNLTGLPLQEDGTGRGNAFVSEFVRWASEHGLPEECRGPTTTYMQKNQVHLAFSYLVRTRWFNEGRANLFTGHPAFHKFQALVLYFFGGLFYYLGLSTRTLPRAGESIELPHSITMAGNGSRYMEWLTDFAPMRRQGNVFTEALGRLVAEGAGMADDPGVTLPEVKVSPVPKEEVARGLVAQVDPSQLPDQGALTTPVVGEGLALRLGGGTERRSFEAFERFDSQSVIQGEDVLGVEWKAEESQIERFHNAMMRCADSVAGYGEQWAQTRARFRQFFDRFERARIRDLTEGRLQYMAELERGFRGSIFLLEVAVVLEVMRDQFFAE